MDIFHTMTDGNKYRVTIISDFPILVSYYDLIAMRGDLNLTLDGMNFCLRNDDCPTPINHDDSTDGAPEDGIWVYDRLMAFFDWMMNRSAYAPMLVGAKSDYLSD